MLRIALLAVLIFVAAAGGMLARRLYLERTPPAGAAEFFVGARKLTVERAMVRNPDLRQGGAVNRLDLALRWLDFRGAAGGSVQPLEGELVFIALEDATARIAAPGDIDPADRPGELYARFLGKEAWSNPGGLIMRRFRPGTPYEGEELYISTPDERMFSARCPQPGGAVGPDDLCLWQTRIEGLDLQVRFPQKLLVHWERMAVQVRTLIPQLARKGGAAKG